MLEATHVVDYIDSPAPAGGRRFDDPRPLGPVVRCQQLLVFGGHEERRRDEVEVLHAAEVLHLLNVLEQLVLAGQLVRSEIYRKV